MNGIELVIIALIMYVVAYKLYGGFLSKRLNVNNNKETPAHTMSDGVDYCPAKAPVLLGHHFASIAGAGPIVGPVIAAGFGWMPFYLHRWCSRLCKHHRICSPSKQINRIYNTAVHRNKR